MSLEMVNTSEGRVAEEIEVVSISALVHHRAEFTFEAFGEDLPAADGTSLVGSTSDTLFAHPEEVGMHSASTSESVDVQGRGLRVGFTPLSVEAWKTDLDSNIIPQGPPKTLTLDPDVLLVPIEAAVIYSDALQLNASRRSAQLAYWDHVAQADAVRFFADGQLSSVQRDVTVRRWTSRELSRILA